MKRLFRVRALARLPGSGLSFDGPPLQSLCLIVLLVLLPQLAAAQSVVATDAMRKIKTTTDLSTIPTAASISISAAKNEFEAFQVVVRGPASGVSGSASSLSGPGGFTLSPASCSTNGNIRLYREEIINITNRSGSYNGGTGGYPDALIANVDEYDLQCRSAFPFDVPPGENRVVWYEVFVPSNAPAGNYSGNVVVGGTTIPVTLTVWDFQLPPTASLRSYFALSPVFAARHNVGGLCTTGASNLRQRYSALALDHRISTPYFDDGCAYNNWADWDRLMGPLLDGTGPSFMGGAKMTSSNIMFPDGAQSVYNDWANHYTQKGWFDRLFVYAGDEPGSGAPHATPWDVIVTHSDKAHSADPNFRSLVTTTIDRARTSPLGDLTAEINILVPNLLDLDAKTGNTRGQYEPWASGINEVWQYISCTSQGCGVGASNSDPWPNYVIDASMIQARGLEWISFKNRLKGELYYDTVYAYSLGDPWVSQWDPGFNGNGDGTFFYPGTVNRIGGTSEIPVSSLRMKMVREGMEDFEYLNILAGQNDRAWAESQVSALFPAAYQIEQDPQRLYDTRKALACRILTNVGKPCPGSNPTLTIAKTGSGTGTVASTSPPPGFSCGSQCSASYLAGTVVTISATADSGSNFAGWSGACSGTAPTCTVTMDVSKTVGGTFNSITCTKSDCFNRPDSPNVGPNWNTYSPALQITSGQATNTDSNGKASQWLQSIGPDQDVAVDCKVTGTGSNCGLMGRWSDANNHYYAYLDAGLGVDLWRVQAGTYTRIGTAARPIAVNTFYHLRLLIQGSSVSVYFNNEESPAISVTDTALTAGNYGGLHAFAGAVQSVWYSTFDIQATIAFRAMSTDVEQSTSTRSMNLTVPTSVQPNDVVIATIVAGDYPPGPLPVVAAPSGWTLVKQIAHGTEELLQIYSRVAVAGDAGTTYSWTTDIWVGAACSLVAYSGVNTQAPIDASAVQDNSTASSTYATPTVTTTSAGDLLLATYAGFSLNGSQSTWSTPAGMTQRVIANRANLRLSLSNDDAIQPTAGPSATYSATASLGQTYALTALVALRPSSAPPPIAFRAMSTDVEQSTSTRSMSLTVPTSVQPDDVMIATIVAGDYPPGPLPVVTAPSEWTLVRQIAHGTEELLQIYSRVAVAGDAGTTYSWTTDIWVGAACSLVAYSGVNAQAPIDASAVQDNSTASATYATPAVTTTSAGDLLLATYAGFSLNGSQSTWSTPAGMTQRVIANRANLRLSLSNDDAIQPTSGPSATYSATASLSQTYALTALVALKK